MSFLNFETLSGPLSKLSAKFDGFGLNLKYGVHYDIEADAEGVMKTRGRRRGALFSNHVTALGYVNVEYADDMSVYDGINKIMLGADGAPCYELVAAAVEKHYATNREEAVSYTRTYELCNDDNVVMILYNLLRYYHIKQLVKKDCKVSPEDIIYDDGHVQVDARSFLGINQERHAAEFDFNANIGASKLPEINKYTIDFLIEGVVLDCANMTETHINALRLACSSVVMEELPFRIAHNSEQACSELYYTNNKIDVSNEGVSFSDLSAENFKSALTAIVLNNRLQAQFDMAYAMYVQMIYQHTPRSAESFVWYVKRPTLVLSKARTARALHPLIIGGQPMVTDVSRWETFSAWRKHPDRAGLHSIALSEAVTCATFEYVTRANKFEDDPLRIVLGSVLISDTGLARELALANMRTGYNMKMPWVTTIGLRRYNWMDESELSKVLRVRVLDPLAARTYNIVNRIIAGGETVSLLQLLEIVPACYPILSMGVNVSKYYMNETYMEVEAKVCQETGNMRVYTAHDAHKLMAMLRVMGFNATVRRSEDNKTFSNWAPNANGHYVPAFAATEKQDEYFEFESENLVARQHNWLMLPYAEDKFKLKVKMNFITFSIFVDGQRKTILGAPVIIEKLKEGLGEVRVLGEQVHYTQVDVKGVDSVRAMQDFRRLWQTGMAVAQAEVFTGPSAVETVYPIQPPAPAEYDA
uniref:Coat protein n=1 Tax=Conidiobolus lamprauges totivirus 2 TaxID=2980981 RepID=A0A977R5I3_9VIRU|nr:coat protein [Conidiobolus lamprauges totivirus 2]